MNRRMILGGIVGSVFGPLLGKSKAETKEREGIRFIFNADLLESMTIVTGKRDLSPVYIDMETGNIYMAPAMTWEGGSFKELIGNLERNQKDDDGPQNCYVTMNSEYYSCLSINSKTKLQIAHWTKHRFPGFTKPRRYYRGPE